MKTINNYINEKLKISNKKTKHTLFPKDKKELQEMIEKEIHKNGVNCSLNHIDVSNITDMSNLFYPIQFEKFNGDISQWDVSNVTDMGYMFKYSKFNQDISNWYVSSVINMANMFSCSEFNGDISDWDVSNVENMEEMFYKSKFNQDISNWKFNNKCIIRGIFYMCPIEDKYKPKKPKP